MPPCAVENAEVDVAARRGCTWLARMPSAHVACGADRLVPVQDRHQLLRIAVADRLPDVLHHLGHVQGDDQTALQVVSLNLRGSDGDLVLADQRFDEPYELREEECPPPGPVFLHLVVYVPRRLEDDALGSEFAGEVPEVNGVDIGDVRLAVDCRRQIGNRCGLGGIELKGAHLVPIKRQPRAVGMVDAHDVGA